MLLYHYLIFQIFPPHQVSSWISPSHIAHMTAAAAAVNAEKRSPPPQRTPSPPSQPSDPDAPLNLTKPKSSSSGSAGSSPQTIPSGLQNPTEQPVAATTPKLLPPNLVMPRPFMPYPALPPQFSPLPPSMDRHKTGKDGLGNSSDKSPFPLHMYGLPTPPHLSGKSSDCGVKDEPDFMTAVHSKFTI